MHSMLPLPRMFTFLSKIRKTGQTLKPAPQAPKHITFTKTGLLKPGFSTAAALQTEQLKKLVDDADN